MFQIDLLLLQIIHLLWYKIGETLTTFEKRIEERQKQQWPPSPQEYEFKFLLFKFSFFIFPC